MLILSSHLLLDPQSGRFGTGIPTEISYVLYLPPSSGAHVSTS